MSAGHWRSYVKFLRSNQQFRRFWLAGVISQFGNWFNYIAIFVLLKELTGSGQAVSWFLIAKFMPTSVFGPAAGIIADRLPRKAIMISCDLARVVVVLGFLFVRCPEHVWLIYFLALVQETLWSFANPARQASVPNLCRPDELNLANALSGASWSVLLAFGAALGGLATAVAGWETAIIIDALTFLLSAIMLSTLTIPSAQQRDSASAPAKETTSPAWLDYIGYNDLKAGVRYVASHRKVAALLLVKSGWALSGGILVMLVVFGEQVLPTPASGDGGGGSGILYSCRGIGAAIGPILAWRVLGEKSQDMMKGIALSFFISAFAYTLFSQTASILWAAPLVMLGHIGGATQWVFSTSLLHRVVKNQYRGRVFAAEMAAVTLVLSLSTYFTGAALENGMDPRHITLALALLFLLPGIAWLLYLQKK